MARDKRNWFVYIIECRDEKLYVGIALDVEKRVQEHNKGLACRFTKYRWPVKLMFEEKFSDKSSARKREIEIKKLKRKEKEELIKKGPSAFSPREASNFASQNLILSKAKDLNYDI